MAKQTVEKNDVCNTIRIFKPEQHEVERFFYELSLILLDNDPIPNKEDFLSEGSPKIIDGRTEPPISQYRQPRLAV
jgi:hypothetical protein